ncbi:hypothetical protein V7S43_015568 [Phytophthora oleae]|uniref:Uncharacterized protein n=1 Tax=Phytophthora oleae TaxID=2107226 RepID=A0ABD3EXL4_9STRA
MPPIYYYLKPGAFNVVGFAYGKVEAAAKSGKVKVKLVASGRWTEEAIQMVELAEVEIDPRVVSVDEALDGADIFVGGVICTARVQPGGACVWDYGLVVGYHWDPEQRAARR